MKLDELKQYTTLKENELYYEIVLAQLNNAKTIEISYYPSSAISVVPNSKAVSSQTERLAIASIEYAEKIELQIREAEKELKETRQRMQQIKDFINSVEDEETKMFLRYFAYLNEDFSKIARRKYRTRNYVAKRIKGVCD